MSALGRRFPRRPAATAACLAAPRCFSVPSSASSRSQAPLPLVPKLRLGTDFREAPLRRHGDHGKAPVGAMVRSQGRQPLDRVARHPRQAPQGRRWRAAPVTTAAAGASQRPNARSQGLPPPAANRRRTRGSHNDKPPCTQRPRHFRTRLYGRCSVSWRIRTIRRSTLSRRPTGVRSIARFSTAIASSSPPSPLP